MEQPTNTTENKKPDILTVLGYIFGGLFILAGISALTMTFLNLSIWTGVFYIISGMFIFPPIWIFLKKDANFELPRAVRAVACFICLMITGNFLQKDLVSIIKEIDNYVESTTTTPRTNINTKYENKETTPSVGKNTVTQEKPKETITMKPIKLTGQGQQATEEFHLNSGLVKFELEHKGTDYFSVYLLDDQGDTVDILASKIGDFEGSKAVKIKQSGDYLLNISGDGNWTVNIK